ncbi:alpha-mannosidase [Listeria costaricensis]|uniref:alpha-mannosidase n=1 Tax=Listeria costaricensis TaxID=2026604 RepID=UPI000C06988B|nr:alpha-mannosidase [Listeria costaricensis]
MFLTEEKLRRRLDEVDLYRHQPAHTIERFQTAEDDGQNGLYPHDITFSNNDIHLGERWTGRDRYLWLQTVVTFPSIKENARLVGYFDFGTTGDGNNFGFESLLFVNGTPYQGVDQNHKEVLFPDDFAGRTVTLTFRLWSGLEGGGQPREQTHEIKRAFIGYLLLGVDDLYFTAKAALTTHQVLAKGSLDAERLLQATNRSFKMIDWSLPGDAACIASIETAGQFLKTELAKLPPNKTFEVSAVGHTHIDVAWLWRLAHTREKAARSFSTVLHLMEDYPEYQFLQTQPQLYAYIKRDYPEIYERIKARIESGEWEAEGGMWLEADCNIPSGESLVRQFLYGQKFLREEFGKPSTYLWLPDVFGYSFALPQIMKKVGLDTFMTTKISWNQYNRMPHDTFMWRGIDGTEILTHFITAPDQNSHISTYNGKMTASELTGLWDRYQDKQLESPLLLAYGYGDGGGGVNREMLEMRRRFDEMPGMPTVKAEHASSYFKKLHQTVDETDQYVHTWDGELYFEYHRGTYTSQAAVKKANRKLELRLRRLEWLLQSRALQHGDRYPHAELAAIWEIVLRNQFHDIIPGSSIKEVYMDARLEYQEAEQKLGALEASFYERSLRPDRDRWTVWNSSSFGGARYVEISCLGERLAFENADGEALPAEQLDADSWLVYLPDVAPLAATSISVAEAPDRPAVKAATPFHFQARQLETPFYRVAWNEAGQISELFDKQNQRSVLKTGQRGNVFQLFEDKPLWHDAWDIDLFYQEKMAEVTDLTRFEVLHNGPLRFTLATEWQTRFSTIRQKTHFYHQSAEIRFETTVDWQDRNKLLKVAFPIDVHAREATYDIQYGNVKRPTHWNTSWDHARFETVCHQWIDLSEKGYGVSLLNDSKYGSDVKDSVMRLSLLKAAGYPDPDADRGLHSFTYSLYPHTGDFIDGGTAKAAWHLNDPLLVQKGTAAFESAIQLSGENVMIDAVKQAEDGSGTILRLHEFAGSHTSIRLTTPCRQLYSCNLLEEIEQELAPAESIALSPYEILTLRLV